jgi:hypothetical protein
MRDWSFRNLIWIGGPLGGVVRMSDQMSITIKVAAMCKGFGLVDNAATVAGASFGLSLFADHKMIDDRLNASYPPCEFESVFSRLQ